MLSLASHVTSPALWARGANRREEKVAIRKLRLVSAMVSIVALVAGLAYGDARRESAAALQDSAQKQAALAQALARVIAIQAGGANALADAAVLDVLGQIGQPDALVVLLHCPGESVLRTSDGRRLASATVAAALARQLATARIPRDEAPLFGLPARTALAGMSPIASGSLRGWDVVAVASAERERDRQIRARRRLVLSVLTAAGLVLFFGGMAMRNQRKELLLERELAIANLQNQRDERLQRANRAAVVGTLAMGVAHEISTPLGIITARAEQLVPKLRGDERGAAGVAAIFNQIDRINAVVRGLLGLARGEIPAAERIEPGDLIQQAVDLTEHRFQKADVRLTKAVEAAGLPALLGDPRLLEQAIVNLLLNACDASRPGDEVVVRTGRAGRDVEIAVEDSGAGISTADIDRALEPFFTTKGRGEGTGLGLAIAHEIVASHRGTLSITARSSRGTTAAIRLPPAEGPGDV